MCNRHETVGGLREVRADVPHGLFENYSLRNLESMVMYCSNHASFPHGSRGLLPPCNLQVLRVLI